MIRFATSTCLVLKQHEVEVGLKFIYSEKAKKNFEIDPLLLSYVVPVKSKGKISHNFVAFSEYMNFNSSPFQAALISGKQCVTKVYRGNYPNLPEKKLIMLPL